MESFCGNDLLRRSLYIFERGLVSIGKLTYQMICACSSTQVWDYVFSKGNRKSNNPPNKKRKTVVHKSLN